MTDQQPKALRLADGLCGSAKATWSREESADELRRLHEDYSHAMRRIDEYKAELSRLQAGGGQGAAYFQVYRCKIKNRRQIMKEIPREQQGWWADVAAGQVLNLRQATQADLDRCNLGAPRSRDPQDYMCETFERGSLVSKAALEYMNPEQLVFARVGAHPPAAPALVQLDTPTLRTMVAKHALAIDPAATLERFPEALAFQIDMARALLRDVGINGLTVGGDGG